MTRRGCWVTLAAALAAASLLLSGCGMRSGNAGITIEAPKMTSGETTKRVTVNEDQVREGDLVLINQAHPIPAGYVPDGLVNVYEEPGRAGRYALLDGSIRLPERLLRQFSDMVDAAAKDGVDHFIISSGYRDNEAQQALYEEKGADTALPAGHSEHNLGLSLDIGSTLKEMDKAPEGKWLKNNAWKHGFILRYPKDKTDITGIRYEPWHFRYVGLPHSAIMHRKDITLEEYLSYLKDRRTIAATVGGEKYEISYVPVRGSASIEVPAGRPYDISGDNSGGVIVTIKL